MRMSKYSCPTINRKLLPVKLHYFFFMAALACGLPFRTVFAKQIGLSGTEVGVIFCVFPFLRIISNPIFGFILDYFKRFRLTISLTLIVVAVSHVCLIFIPPKTATSEMSVTDYDLYTQLKYSCERSKDFPNVCDLKMVMYNEYRMETSGRDGSNFACDIMCSDSSNETRMENEYVYCAKLLSQFTIFVNASMCDIDIQLDSGKVVDMRNTSPNFVVVNLKDSLVENVKSWLLTSSNCSLEPTHSIIIQEFNKSDIADNFCNAFQKYVSVPVSENLQNKKMFYALQEFMIHNASDSLHLGHRNCSFEYKCETKKCVYKAQNVSDLENVMVGNDRFASIQFWSIFMLFTTACVTFGGMMFMMDAVCYELLQDKKHQFGQQRLWGTVSWGLGCLAGGYLNQIASTNSTNIDYSLSFYLLAFLIFIDILFIYQLKITDLKYSPNIMKDVCFLFTKVDIVYNLLVVCIIGALSGFMWNYQFWFMEEIGSSQVLLGLSQIVECLFELPWFVISGWIINKIGHDHCNSIALLCFGLRYLCFVFMYNPWWTLAAAVFHGPTFGLFYASMTMYAKNKAPPGTEATVQSLLHLSFEGIGVSAGSMLGGIGLDKLGSRISFMHSAQLSFVLLFINVLMSIYFLKSRNKSVDIKNSVSTN